jgi:chromosome segregation ATPase
MLCCKDLEATINSQMQHIEAQEIEKESLEIIIEELNKQLMQTGERMKAVENRICELEQELEEVKQPVTQTDTYYMNPMYDRTQFEEKILTEMIEFESDLLLGKEQIQLMTDAIVDLIKLASFSLEDLQATKYFLGTFHRSVYRITKDIKSMENVDLEHLLCLKDDTHSFYDSELGMEETRRSQISTRSEVELDQKLSRITEDDSLSTIHGE